MVMRTLCLFLLLPLSLFSGEFTATVSRNSVGVGEGFTLNLTLKEASAKTAPTIDLLKNDFLVHSQQQLSNTVITNGKIASSIIWKLVLIPQNEGSLTIPAISIDSSDGILASEPIAIQVVKATASKNEDAEGVQLAIDVSNRKPYKNEPIFYTVKLSSKQSMANIQMQKLNVEDAIVEMIGEPVIFEKVEDGVRVGVIEFRYLVTPLKSGMLKIPSVVIQGGVAVKRTSRMQSWFGEAMDPFSFMQGFEQLQPFALSTEEAAVEVQSPVADSLPWIPAKALMITEKWDESQPLQAGEFFTRSFEITAEGMHSSQLPSLDEQQKGNGQFKVYADKPELADDIKEGSIKSIRKEAYTLIPQQSGPLTLPEISVVWWDVVNKEKVVARVPARTLEVLPAKEVALNTVSSSLLEEEKTVVEAANGPAAFQLSPIVYAVIFGLVTLLAGAIVWGILLQQKMKRLLAVPEEPKAKPLEPKPVVQALPSAKKLKSAVDKKERLNDLNPT